MIAFLEKEATMQMPLSLTYAQEQQRQRPYRRICDMPISERPLYRLHHNGPNALATLELLTLTLGGANAPGLAENLLHRFGSLHQLVRASKAQLMKTRGIGEAQAARLVAIMELSRRLQSPPADERPYVKNPADGASLLFPRLSHLEQEELHVILLDTRNRVLDIQAIYKGSLNSSMIRIGEIFRPAIEAPAAAVIIAHNHPSGQADPSPEDVTVTKKIVEAGKLLDIEVLDHLVIGNGHFVSLKERGTGFD
jgi:DNA repair protein RadC